MLEDSAYIAMQMIAQWTLFTLAGLILSRQRRPLPKQTVSSMEELSGKFSHGVKGTWFNSTPRRHVCAFSTKNPDRHIGSRLKSSRECSEKLFDLLQVTGNFGGRPPNFLTTQYVTRYVALHYCAVLLPLKYV